MHITNTNRERQLDRTVLAPSEVGAGEPGIFRLKGCHHLILIGIKLAKYNDSGLDLSINILYGHQSLDACKARTEPSCCDYQSRQGLHVERAT